MIVYRNVVMEQFINLLNNVMIQMIFKMMVVIIVKQNVKVVVKFVKINKYVKNVNKDMI